MKHLSEEQRLKIAERLAFPNRSAEDGSTPQSLAQVLELPLAGERAVALAHALVDGVRLLVPAHPQQDESGQCNSGQSARICVAPGREANCVFSDMDQLRAFDPLARPLVSPARQTAATASMESGRLVLNPGPEQVILGRAATGAVVAGDRWLPPWQDAELIDHVALLARELGLGKVGINPDKDGFEVISIRVPACPDTREKVEQWIRVLRADEMVSARCDLVRIIPLPQ